MVEAICKEVRLQKQYLDLEPVSTIYFGGGTPSLLNRTHLEAILEEIVNTHEISQDVEITLEANPDDITDSVLPEWLGVNINRLSIGIQSFDDITLKFMNRIHNSKDALASITRARSAGFSNLNIDLIYGISNPDHSRWISDLKKILQLKPEHISAYCLTIEEKTVFGRWLEKGKIQPVDDDFSAEEFKMLSEKLKTAGYVHYEVSNFCLPGMESKHNAGYWKNEKYLGIGPGAHSFNLNCRQQNISNNALYIKSIQMDQIPFKIEKLGAEEKINEYLLTTLRTRWGASTKYLKDVLGFDILFERKEYLEIFRDRKYLRITDDTITLTEDGFLLADKITADLFV